MINIKILTGQVLMLFKYAVLGLNIFVYFHYCSQTKSNFNEKQKPNK